MAIRIFNVSGSKQMTDTKDNPNVKLLAGETIDLEGYHKIGNKMKQQIDAKLFKLREIKIGIPASESTQDKKAAVPPVDLEALATSDVPNDGLIKAVMRNMIARKDNLGRDGKPNQPVLAAAVMKLRNKITQVKADLRDRLYVEIKKEDASE